MKSSLTWAAALLAALTTTLCAQQSPQRVPLPAPTHANVKYGPHERNVFDLWLPESKEPAPLVLFIHGGGFQAGDKSTIGAPNVTRFREIGWAVAAINYRLTNTAPAPAAYLDCARALQHLRHHSKEWNLNANLAAATGGSAGAGTSLWIAFHDDLAKPDSPDPVERESTRLTCVSVENGQSSYDPRFAESIGIPRPNFERHSFFLPFYGITREEIATAKAEERYTEMAPITYLTKDDPAVRMGYSFPNTPVKDATADLNLVVHHPLLGIALKERMEKLGLRCVVQYRDPNANQSVRHGGGQPISTVDFIREEFAKAQSGVR